MKMKKLLVYSIIFAAAASCTLEASFSRDDAGTASAQFLKIGIGARAVGLGEAYGAVADDSYALYWNPAGLGQLKLKSLDLTYSIWLQRINLNYLAFAYPFSKGTIGLA